MLTENDLVASCTSLMGDEEFLTSAERELVGAVQPPLLAQVSVDTLRTQILDGLDPLGDAFSLIRSPKVRRGSGAVYTPQSVVDAMLTWIAAQPKVDRFVDPGAGSGRFILAAGKAFPDAELIAVEMDPLASLMLRANLHVLRLDRRVTVLVQDYRDVVLSSVAGITAFIGNPPYVRHHVIAPNWKDWYSQKFARLGIKASALAGLHLHFFLKTQMLARPADIGAFVTSAEWMDVNYGSALRDLLLNQLGGVSLDVLDPSIETFPGTATTAAITCFRVGERTCPVRIRSVTTAADLDVLQGGVEVSREQLKATPRWSSVLRPRRQDVGETIELGEMCRVHRGQVTGANSVWIAREQAVNLPERVKVPAVTKAKDLIEAGARLHSAAMLRRVIDLPANLDDLESHEQKTVREFLKWARAQGADQGYVARHRKAWWSVGLREPAPILCTYMARRAPQFTLNACGARHINIAHGIYPRDAMSHDQLTRMVEWLNSHVHISSGRTYSGGLTKFEPKEMERLRIPKPEVLFA